MLEKGEASWALSEHVLTLIVAKRYETHKNDSTIFIVQGACVGVFSLELEQCTMGICVP